jgi:hypothetical protein
VGCNIQVHGSNTKNLSVELSLCQTSKNIMSFLLSVMFSPQQNQIQEGIGVLPSSGRGVGRGRWPNECIHM